MLHSVRFTLATVVGAGLAALSACDTAGEGPPPIDEGPPPLCEAAPLVERADTMFVAVGDSAALDLEVLFAGTADEPLTFALVIAQNHVVLRDGRAIVSPVLEGVTRFRVRAASACGVVAEAVVTVSALPSGTSCPAPPAVPVGYVRMPTGGAVVARPIWGPDGVVAGVFHFDSPADVEGGDGLVQASVVYGDGAVASLRITPGNQAGVSTLSISATDACFRPVVVDVPIEVVHAPDCVFVEAGYADFFPLEVGRTWTYRYTRGFSAGLGGGTSWEESGDEMWEMVGSSSCDQGYREHTLTVTRTPDAGSPAYFTMVLESNSGTIRQRPYVDPLQWPSIPRYNPPDPGSLTFGVGGGTDYARVTVQRDVGIVATDVLHRGGAYSFEYYERTLVGY